VMWTQRFSVRFPPPTTDFVYGMLRCVNRVLLMDQVNTLARIARAMRS